jgi:DNA-binding response OmpR family regulator
MNAAKIMIVDDDRPLSHLISRILVKSGRYITRVENNPRAAAKAAQEFRPDVFLLDVDMPGYDGGTLLAELRSNPLLASTPSAFLTSLISAKETQCKLTERGGDFYLAKTLDLPTLERGIHQLLAGVAK